MSQLTTLVDAATPLDRIALLPKVELHCHGWAVVDPEILAELRDRGFETPITPGELATLTPTGTFEEFVEWHRRLKPLRRNFEALKVVLAIHVERLKRQQVKYAEIMQGTSPIDLGDPPLPDNTSVMIDKMRQLRALTNSVGGGQTQVEFTIGCTTRGRPEVFERWVEPLIAMYEAGVIVGLAWGGLDEGHALHPHARSLAALHEAGIPMEIHAGEWDGPQRIHEAIEEGFASRIGHGIAAFQDPYLLDLLKERQIHLELCPTSNACTGVVPSMEEHPLREALELGLNFSINTDDPGTFACTVESEYRLAAEKFGFSEDDLLHVTANAMASLFPRRFGSNAGDAEALARAASRSRRS